ncbi:hypothetical protein [Fundidesulfovibrio terrae]|uniref:hypothetical protein n=1 Tax=Fundidesulfovibrio terrae TaxID=2922866 RepID=UPI001FAF37C9|nr:hypothetical protein [Fundidesulfovibrio terrae]
MKRAFIAVALLLAVAATAFAQGKIILDYKGMAFGKDFSEFKLLKEVRKSGDMVFYAKYQEEPTFQGVPVKDQMYGFYKGKFCLAMFTAQGPSAYNTLKAYFDAHYGPASQPKVNIKQFTYMAGDVAIQLGFDDARKVVDVSYAYNPIMRQFMPAGGNN